MEIINKIKELITAYKNKDYWTAAKIGFALAVMIADVLSKMNGPKVVGYSVNPDQTTEQMVDELELLVTETPENVYGAYIFDNVVLSVLVLKIVQRITSEILSRLTS